MGNQRRSCGLKNPVSSISFPVRSSMECEVTYRILHKLYHARHVILIPRHLCTRLVAGAVPAALAVRHIHDRVFRRDLKGEDVSHAEHVRVPFARAVDVRDNEADVIDEVSLGGRVGWRIVALDVCEGERGVGFRLARHVCVVAGLGRCEEEEGKEK